MKLRRRDKPKENRSKSIGRKSERSKTNSSSSKEKTKNPVTQNKFFKSKTSGEVNSQKIQSSKKLALPKVLNKHKQPRKKDSIEFVPALRQTTLSESFKRSSLYSRLRPRKITKESKDSLDITALLEKSISPDKRNSIVLIERIDKPQEGVKLPVYKSVEPPAKNTEDKESVYEFDFDANDPTEKKNKTRRKKRAPKKVAPIGKKKVVTKKERNIPKNLVEPSKNLVATEEDGRDVASCDRTEKNEPTRVAIENIKKNTAGCDYNENNELPCIENQDHSKGIAGCDQGEKTELLHVGIENEDQSPVKENVSPENLPLRENVRIKHQKPKISSIENLTEERKVSFKPALSLTRQNSMKFNPFRSTQSIFKPRPTLNPKDMMEHSLLNKSLSPIKNDLNNFDVASPWRSPLGENAFSSIKQVVQSTPRINRNLERPTLGAFKQTQRILENDENENLTDFGGDKPGAVLKQGENRVLKPLGNRISNAENIQASSNTVANVCKIGERKSFGQSFSYGENKKHSGFGDRLYKSPIKNDKTVTKSHGSIGLKMRNEDLPSPALLSKKLGPRSGTYGNDHENLPPSEESRLLKQSNLNTFLNIDDVPESTMINTSHGIFGEAYSTPTVTSKVQTRPTVENCFGFDEDYSEIAETSVKLDNQKKKTTPIKKVYQRLKERILPVSTEQPSSSVVKPARISLGEIKNTLYPKKEIKLDKDEKEKQTQGPGMIKVSEDSKRDGRSKDVLNTGQFSDTFDILSESGQGNGTEKSGTEVGLFTDLEPVHFTKVCFEFSFAFIPRKVSIKFRKLTCYII